MQNKEYSTISNFQANSLTSVSDRLNTRTETQIEELHDILDEINNTISQLSDILQPVTVSVPTEGSVAIAPQKPNTTLIYDKLDQFKDKAISTGYRLDNLKRSIEL